MARIKRLLSRAAIQADLKLRSAEHRLYMALGGPGPLEIIAYRGYGTAGKLHVKGRVVVDKGVRPSAEADTLWRNVRNMYKRINAHAIPRARIRARFQGAESILETDPHGYFETWMRPTGPLPGDGAWHEVSLTLEAPLNAEQGEVHATAQVLVPPARACFVVISDLDDTVVKTGATRMLSLARESFLGNAYTRLPFPGVAAFYRALRDGDGGDRQNPLLYVSRSPWNLYDLLSEFFAIHDIPVGPVLFLREWGLSAEGLTVASVQGLKYALISRMLELYSELPFVLLGDSGQKDPEIYTAIVEKYPGRVRAVYIRNVSRAPERLDALRALAKKVAGEGSTFILAEDSLAMARHAAENGWIDPARLPEIEGEKVRDQAPPSVSERILGQEKEEGPVVEVAPGAGSDDTRRAVEAGAVEEALERGDEKKQKPPKVVVEGRPRRPG